MVSGRYFGPLLGHRWTTPIRVAIHLGEPAKFLALLGRCAGELYRGGCFVVFWRIPFGPSCSEALADAVGCLDALDAAS